MRLLKNLFVVVVGIGGLILVSVDARAQSNIPPGQSESSVTFYAEAIAYASDQPRKSRIEVYSQVPYEEIRFVKEGDQYVARYDMTLTLTTPSKDPVTEQTWTVDVPVSDFAQTSQSKLYSLTHRVLDIDPGNYQLAIQLRDQESKRSAQIRRTLLVLDFTKDSLSISDIMLVNRLETSGDRKSIVPNISGTINVGSQGFYVFFEMYNSVPMDSADLTMKIFNSKKEEVFSRHQRQAVTGYKTPVFLKVDSSSFPMGSYFLEVDASASPVLGGVPTAIKGMTSRTFSVRSSDLPVAITDLDKAIDQLIYIAKDSELEYIRSGQTMDEKRKRFLEFWAKRDPDPSTARNELMEEYYARVQYCNQNFSHYLEGWRTDRGMVLIRFGMPENIERHPFEIDSRPYEIWYYYQLNRQFIFVDETGFGDYRLRYPTTDLWGRVR